ncbi:hypothetical protein KKH39_04430 [Patescibacteria group bacterium]|nr:hypothetical protein [Patescibacteria group bacterium]
MSGMLQFILALLICPLVTNIIDRKIVQINWDEHPEWHQPLYKVTYVIMGVLLGIAGVHAGIYH